MQVMKGQEDSRKLHGDIVIDDAYLGGERQGKRGRGSENKIPFVAAVQLKVKGKRIKRYLPQACTISRTLTHIQGPLMDDCKAS